MSAMALEELHKLFNSEQKRRVPIKKTLEQYFAYFDKELQKIGVTKQF